jgi:hypothetical protein
MFGGYSCVSGSIESLISHYGEGFALRSEFVACEILWARNRALATDCRNCAALNADAELWLEIVNAARMASFVASASR